MISGNNIIVWMPASEFPTVTDFTDWLKARSAVGKPFTIYLPLVSGEIELSTPIYDESLIMRNTSLVPAGYTQLEYIQGDSTPLDTGVIPSNDTAWELKFAYTQIKTNYNRGFGVQEGTQKIIALRSSSTSGSGNFYLESNTPNGSVSWSGRELDLNNHIVILNDNGVFRWDDIVLTSMNKGISDTITKTFTLFSNNGISSDYVAAKFYYCKCKSNTTGELLCNLIPCKNSSNIVGMYDTVSGQFITPTTGTLTAGPELYTKQFMIIQNEEA